MQTVLFKEINGYKIIMGFSELSIDPVETQKAIIPVLKKDKNVKRVEDLKRQLEILENQMRAIRIKKVITPIEKKQHDDYEGQRQVILKEIIGLLELIKKRKDELTIEKAVYFQPVKNELEYMGKPNSSVPAELIEKAILLIRGQKVMLDRDLAEFYGVTTGNLSKLPPVKRVALFHGQRPLNKGSKKVLMFPFATPCKDGVLKANNIFVVYVI